MNKWLSLPFFFFLSLYLSNVAIQYANSFAASSLVIVKFPEVIDLRVNSKWVACYLVVIAEQRTATDVNISSILLMDKIEVERSFVLTKKILMLHFNRSQLAILLEDLLDPRPYIRFKFVTLKVTGAFMDGTLFEGFDKVKIIFP
jgi:hypothetical protein